MQTLRRISARSGGVFGCRRIGSGAVQSCVAASMFVALLVLVVAIGRAPAANEVVERIVVNPGRASTTVTLRDRLVVGLEARLKSEVAFVELVVAKVRTGQLPQRLVDETFLWARQRVQKGRMNQSYRPIVFFQPAMKLRAKRLKVDL
jgi:hypothetical protein